MSEPSPRLAAIINALPLEPNMRVLEIGCGSGAAAREVARRVVNGSVLAIDRSAKAILAALRATDTPGNLRYLAVAIEDFELPVGESRYDLAFAVRVGALDGRHPELCEKALQTIAAALKPGGKLFIDGGDPLQDVPLPSNGTLVRG